MGKNVLGKSGLVAALAVGTILGGIVVTQTACSAKDIQSAPAQTQQDHAKLLKQTRDLANKGRVITSEEFGLYSTQKEIESKWGKPDSDSNRAEGEWKYSKHSTFFFLGNDNTDSGGVSTVFQLKTLDKQYASVTAKEVQKTLGEGMVDKEAGYIAYEVENANTLVFYFHVDNKGNFTNVKYVEVAVP